MNATLKLTAGTKVIPIADCPKEAAKLASNHGVGIIKHIVPAIGRAGEDSYYVYWPRMGSGGYGWRDCDVKKA